jgi:hypothetical protein
MSGLKEAAKALRAAADMMEDGRIHGFALAVAHENGRVTKLFHLPEEREPLAALIDGACAMQGVALRKWRGELQ